MREAELPCLDRSTAATRGCFVAVAGPSGAGKDTLIACAAERLAREPWICFVRRVITRPADPASEDHDSLSEEAFRRAEAAGAFSLTWGAHGLRYGLPASVDEQLAQGVSVVANVSRQCLDRAARRFGPLQVVQVTVRPELLAERLAARRREKAAYIAARLQRQVPLELPTPHCRLLEIDNSGELETAVSRFLEYLRSLRLPSSA